MQWQDNSAKNIGFNVEPKDGERTLLSCNTADIRSPSFGFTNEEMTREIALDYLAGVLIEAYFDYKSYERREKQC